MSRHPKCHFLALENGHFCSNYKKMEDFPRVLDIDLHWFIISKTFTHIFNSIYFTLSLMLLWAVSWILLFYVIWSRSYLLQSESLFQEKNGHLEIVGGACSNENNSSPSWTLCVAQLGFLFICPRTNVFPWKENHATKRKRNVKSLVMKKEASAT